MLKERKEAAIKVAESLWAAEEAIDAALVKVAQLNGTLITARTDARLSAIVGHDAFEGAAATLGALTRARGEIVETHKRLSDAQVQIGLRTMAIGDLGKPEGNARHLQVVA
jgi:hypothetical protein